MAEKNIQGQCDWCDEVSARCYPPHRSASPFQIRAFNLRADSAHAAAADLARHHGRITSHNYTAIMTEIKSALF